MNGPIKWWLDRRRRARTLTRSEVALFIEWLIDGNYQPFFESYGRPQVHRAHKHARRATRRNVLVYEGWTGKRAGRWTGRPVYGQLMWTITRQEWHRQDHKMVELHVQFQAPGYDWVLRLHPHYRFGRNGKPNEPYIETVYAVVYRAGFEKTFGIRMPMHSHAVAFYELAEDPSDPATLPRFHEEAIGEQRAEELLLVLSDLLPWELVCWLKTRHLHR